MPTITKDNKPVPVRTFPRRYGLIFITSAFMILGYPWWARNDRHIMGEDFADAAAALQERTKIPYFYNKETVMEVIDGSKTTYVNVVTSDGVTFGLNSSSNVIATTNYFVNLSLKLESDHLFATFVNGTNIMRWDKVESRGGFADIRIFNRRNFPTNESASADLVISGSGLEDVTIPITVKAYGSAEDSVLEDDPPSWGIVRQHKKINMAYYNKIFTERISFSGGTWDHPETHWEQLSNTVTSVTNYSWTAKDTEYYDSAHIERERMIDLFNGFRELTATYDWVDPSEFIQSAVPVFGWQDHIWSSTNEFVSTECPLPFDSTTNGIVFTLNMDNTGTIAHVTFVTSKSMIRNSITGRYPLYPNIWWNQDRNPGFGELFPDDPYFDSSQIEEWLAYWNTNDLCVMSCFTLPNIYPFSKKIEDVDVGKVFDGKGYWWSILPNRLGMETNCYVYPSLETMTNTMDFFISFTNEAPYFVTNWYTKYDVAYNAHINVTNTFQELMEVAKKLNATLHQASQVCDDKTITHSYYSSISDGGNGPYETYSDWYNDALFEESDNVSSNNGIGTFFYESCNFDEYVIATSSETTKEFPDGTKEVTSYNNSYGGFSGNAEGSAEKVTGLMLNYPSLYALTNGYVSEVWIYAVVETDVIVPMATCAPQQSSSSALLDNPEGAPIEKYTTYERYSVTPTADSTQLQTFNLAGYDCCEYDLPAGFKRTPTQKDEIFSDIPIKKEKLNLVKHVANPVDLIRFDFGIEGATIPAGNYQVVSAKEETWSGHEDLQYLWHDDDPSNWVTEASDSYVSYDVSYSKIEGHSANVSFWVMVKWNWKHMNEDNIYKPDEYKPIWYTNSYEKIRHPAYTNEPQTSKP